LKEILVFGNADRVLAVGEKISKRGKGGLDPAQPA